MGIHQLHTITFIAFLACALLFAACGALADSQEKPSEVAKKIADQVLRNKEKSPHGDLGAWSRSVLERALGRTTKNATETSAPLPAESRAGSLAENLSAPRYGSEVIVFMSLSVPAAAWREWSAEAARIGVPLVLRGVSQGGLRATVKRVGAHLPKNAGAVIDPRLFRLLDVTAVPAVAVVPGGVPHCKSRGCSADTAPPHDRVSGNIGLEAALSIIAAKGGPGRETARLYLEKIRGDFP